MNFGEKLAELRTSKGWRQEDLAARLYVTKQAVSKWETDRSFPEVTLIPKIADLLGTTVNELLVETKEQNDEKKIPEFKKEILAERTGLIIDFFLLAFCAAMISIFFISPKFDVRGILIFGMIIMCVSISVFIIIKDLQTPKVIICFNGEDLEIYSKTKETRYVKFNQIENIWTSRFGESYAGRFKIFLKNGEELLFYSIKRPSVAKGKIEALKNYLSNTNN